MSIKGLGSYQSFYSVNPVQTSSGSGAPEGARLSSDSLHGEGAGKEKSTGKGGVSDQVSLSREARVFLEQLKSRDREVRAHEQAHIASGGGLTGGATYSYQTGPDGNQYAIGGEVPIDSGTVAGDPQATISKMRVVKQSALAPAQPSAQDMSVAASADVNIQEAQQILSKMILEKTRSYDESSGQGVGRSTGQNVGVIA